MEMEHRKCPLIPRAEGDDQYLTARSATRPALNDVTSASVNVANGAGGGDVKRQRTADSVQGVVGVT